MEKVKWGILGAASIGMKFICDLKQTQLGEIVAVGASSLERAKVYAESMGIPKYYGSYNQLVADNDVDIIYIATTHNFHYEHAKLCLENNKHVLCEKPITVNANQLDELVALAQSRNLFFMEAMWTVFLPSIKKAQQWVNQGLIGRVTLIQANFGFVATPQSKPRLYDLNLAGGTLLDIGIYPLTLFEMFGDAPIDSLTAQAQFSSTGVDEYLTIQLKYKNGVNAQMATTINTKLKNNATIYGTKGYIELPSFWMAKQARLIADNQTIDFVEENNLIGYYHEIEAVHHCLINATTDENLMPLTRSKKMMQLLDMVRQQIGLVYPFE